LGFGQRLIFAFPAARLPCELQGAGSRVRATLTEDSMLSSTLIYFNKNNEEVARVTFDDNEVPGWCIKSKAEPGFKRKFAAQREACAVWLREFDPETGKLRSKSQKKEMANAY
jgi:hypothetical protein